MSIEDNKAIIRRFVEEVWNKGNLDVAWIVLAPDFVDHSPQPGQPNDRQGYIQGILTLRATFIDAFPDFRVVLHDLVADGDIVACRVAVQGTQVAPLWGLTPGATPLPVTAMVFTRLRDGKIIELWQEQNVQLAEAAASLMERQRLARDLHDSVTQSIFSVSMLARAAQTQRERGSAHLDSTLERVATLAQQALVEMRALLFELRGDAVAEEGLINALHKLIAAVHVRTDLAVTLTAPDSVSLSAGVSQAAFRIVQEALSNAAKHAHANAAVVSVAEADQVEITVRDDGVGFNTEAAPAASGQGGLGLRSMRERAAVAGIALAVDSVPGGGTTIRLRCPLSA